MDDAPINTLAREIETLTAQRGDKWLGWLSELLQFETVSGETDPERAEHYRSETQRCLQSVEARARELGMAFRNYDGQACVAEWTGADPSAPAVGVALHLDVVPAGEGWTHPPFSGARADDAIWGRGAQDDKGPAAMAFAAVDALQALGLRPRRSIRLLMGLQEETGDWGDVRRLIEAGEAPGPVLVPDGEYPIINGEKGMVKLSVDFRWPAVSPAGGGAVRFLSLQSGRRSNMVPDLAVMRLAAGAGADPDDLYDLFDRITTRVERMSQALNVEISIDDEQDGETIYLLEFHGKCAHASTPQQGHNALLDALFFLAELAPDSSADPLTASAAFLARKSVRLDGTELGIACVHPHLKSTSVNLGLLDWDGQGGRAEWNIRFPIGLDAEGICARIEAQLADLAPSAPGLNITCHITDPPMAPLYVSPEEHADFLKPLQQAYLAVTGREAGLASIGGTTYSKIYPLAVAFGPVDREDGDVDLAHQKDERVSVHRHLTNIRIYALALALLAEAQRAE